VSALELTGALSTAPNRAHADTLTPPDIQFDMGDVIAPPQTWDGVTFRLPPVHTVFLTAKLEDKPNRAGRHELDRALTRLENAYPWSAAGLITFVAYGLPYFNRLEPAPVDSHMPRLVSDPTRWVLEEAVPSPKDVVPGNGITKYGNAVSATSPPCNARRARGRHPDPLRMDGPGYDDMDVPDGSTQPKLQFTIFVPTSDFFQHMRTNQAAADLERRYGMLEEDNGLECFITATRRQNFLVHPEGTGPSRWSSRATAAERADGGHHVTDARPQHHPAHAARSRVVATEIRTPAVSDPPEHIAVASAMNFSCRPSASSWLSIAAS
jgi:hypothetical protein